MKHIDVKASSHDHLEANLAVFGFELSDEEMRRIRDPSKLKTGLQFLRSQLSGERYSSSATASGPSKFGSTTRSVCRLAKSGSDPSA